MSQSTPFVLTVYNRLNQMPLLGPLLGRSLFSKILCFKAPYFGSIKPQIHHLGPGRMKVSMKKRRPVLNHIGTVHAIAVCNLCEVVAGTMMEATIPSHMRWIPKGMKVEYLKKADSDLVAEAELNKNDWGESEDVDIVVEAKNKRGDVVTRAVITMWVSPRKAKGQK